MQYFKYVIYITVMTCVTGVFAGEREDFFRAVEADSASVVQRIIEAGFDPNVRDEKGRVALSLALLVESANVARVLLNSTKVDPDLANGSGETPLMMAALRGDMVSVHTLLGRGAKVNREGWTPLHYAASGASTQIVELLLDRGAAIDAPSPNGTTALMMAARYGAIVSADLLQRRGASTVVRNQLDLTAAEFAKGAGRDDLAARLAPK